MAFAPTVRNQLIGLLLLFYDKRMGVETLGPIELRYLINDAVWIFYKIQFESKLKAQFSDYIKDNISPKLQKFLKKRMYKSQAYINALQQKSKVDPIT